MAGSNPFSLKLKELRGDLPVEQLAEKSGVAPASIYKSETTASVRWQTVEKAYRSLFKSTEDHCHTLILWALEQTDGKLVLQDAINASRNLLAAKAEQVNYNVDKMHELLTRLTPPDAELLLEFAEIFASSEPTRAMVRAWLMAMK